MRHPSEGVLRRLLDEPAGVADPDRRHVAGCPQCLAGLAAAQEDAALVGAALGHDAATDVDVHAVPDAATAESETGLVAPDVAALPNGVSGRPSFQAGGRLSATFTFSAERAAQAAAAAGTTLPTPPPGLDGSRLRLEGGPVLAEVWSQTKGVPTLVVGRAGAPTADSSGVPFDTVRDYLLSLPGMPPDV